MRNFKSIITIFILIIICGFTNFKTDNNKDSKGNDDIRSVILMIPDGTSESIITLARWYKNYDALKKIKSKADLENFKFETLCIDSLLCGNVRTYSIDAPIGESAASGSAYATGYKTQAAKISMSQDNLNDIISKGKLIATKDKIFAEDNTKLQTVLEAAKKSGRSTGLVVTCTLTDATPAVFASHCQARDSFNIIAKQMASAQIDVALGGGKAYFDGHTRKYDKLNFIESLTKEGYEIVYDTKSLKEARKDKLWGLFADTDMAYDIDRDKAKEPSLAEMTEAALKILSKNKKGFFLMIEGSKVDKSCHLNDPVGGVTEFIAFDNALQKAVEFAEKDKHTVVIVCPDHGNGGLAIGNFYSNNGKKEDKYSVMGYDKIMKPLVMAKHTVKGVDDILRAEYEKNHELSREFINSVVKDYVFDFNNDEKVCNALTEFIKDNNKKLKSISTNYDAHYYAYNNEMDTILGKYISNKAFLGWTTRGHTGEDVFLAMYHPKKKVITGLVDNTDIGRYIFKIFGSKEGKLN